ncbi:flavin reductase family protein [Echinicola jeungdonensis]|uniref:Flavin reductase family protein n=1 Tax=Echinicola jeungdonensis TaxID=709343 RepID=A0ABV5JBF9_9BACT|nr:flavin reductase family protein [Echinicola jeungdonensis]MDN3670246.1 flavin reductase family protein [Echinicola jeungdonensis]
MKIIDPKDVSVAEFHGLMLGAIAPRPIAFASTMDQEGLVNLSPFSFFNAFGSNPPLLIFSPARRVRNNTTKHSLENVKEVPEVVINIVSYSMVQQMSLSSTEYPKGVNEFVKAGFSEMPSQIVKPPRVKESPAAFECRVRDIISFGKEGGAANLVICEILLAHFKDELFDDQGKIDPHKLDAVARMGGNWYCHAQGQALFEVEKPVKNIGIGVDQIPEPIRFSMVLTGNDLGKLGNVPQLPLKEDIEEFGNRDEIREMKVRFQNDKEGLVIHLHQYAQELLHEGKTMDAWKALLQTTLEMG